MHSQAVTKCANAEVNSQNVKENWTLEVIGPMHQSLAEQIFVPPGDSTIGRVLYFGTSQS